jgi:hypothetical protein
MTLTRKTANPAIRPDVLQSFDGTIHCYTEGTATVLTHTPVTLFVCLSFP